MDWDNLNNNILPISGVNINQALLPFMMIFFAFTGWEVAASTSEEFKNPNRDFPRAMIMSFIAACFLYFAMAFIVQNTKITGSYEASFVSIAEIVFGQSGKIAVSILAAVIIFANLMGAIWAVSRMVLSLSRENYLPFNLKKSENGSPISSVLITSSALLIVLSMDWLEVLDINKMLSIAGQNFLILYGITGIALFKLSENNLEKFLSAITIAIAIVSILLFLQGSSIFYPVCLSATAMIIWYFKKKNKAISQI
jgi:amino acid efflux transporter